MNVIILLRVQGEYVNRKQKHRTALKIVFKVSFSASKWLWILKAFTISFLLNDVQNQNTKVLEEMPAGFNSDAVKITLRVIRNFQNSSTPFLSCWKASPHSSVTLLLGVESNTKKIGRLRCTFKLVCLQFKLPRDSGRLSDLSC